MIDHMARRGVTPKRLAIATGRDIRTVENWMTGTTRPPVFIGKTIEAVYIGLDPADTKTMNRMDLVKELAIPPSTDRTWRYRNDYPPAARLAVSFILSRRNALTPYELRTLRFIHRAVYFDIRGVWRTRSVMGKKYPSIRGVTPRSLIAAGLVEAIGTPARLQLTTKGKDIYYNDR